jgi:predicted HicB family RNase H-like nuclease
MRNDAQLHIRVPIELAEAVRLAAEADRRKLSDWCRLALERAVREAA